MRASLTIACSIALGSLGLAQSAHAFKSDGPSAPKVCEKMSVSQFVEAWNVETASLTIGSWQLPKSGLSVPYEQALDGPSITIRIHGTSQGCLDYAEIWTRHDMSVGVAALVGWVKLLRSLGVEAEKTRSILNDLGIEKKQFPVSGKAEYKGVAYRFEEGIEENSLRAIIL